MRPRCSRPDQTLSSSMKSTIQMAGYAEGIRDEAVLRSRKWIDDEAIILIDGKNGGSERSAFWISTRGELKLHDVCDSVVLYIKKSLSER